MSLSSLEYQRLSKNTEVPRVFSLVKRKFTIQYFAVNIVKILNVLNGVLDKEKMH